MKPTSVRAPLPNLYYHTYTIRTKGCSAYSPSIQHRNTMPHIMHTPCFGDEHATSTHHMIAHHRLISEHDADVGLVAARGEVPRLAKHLHVTQHGVAHLPTHKKVTGARGIFLTHRSHSISFTRAQGIFMTLRGMHSEVKLYLLVKNGERLQRGDSLHHCHHRGARSVRLWGEEREGKERKGETRTPCPSLGSTNGE